MTGVIPRHTLEEHTKALADFLPSGPVFQSAVNTEATLYKFLSGLAVEAKQAEELTSEYQDQFFPDTTNIYLSEWERCLGIPDECFTGDGTTAERQRDIVCKIIARGARTLEDIQQVATKFGITISIRKNDMPSWPRTWPLFWETQKFNRNTVYVSFPGTLGASTWPFTWPHYWSAAEGVLRCLILRVMPAQINVVFE